MIKTKRAQLRRPSLSDIELYQRLESNPDIVKWTPMRTPRTVDQSLVRLENQILVNSTESILGFWLAETIYSSEFIGWFMLVELEPRSPSLGFMIVEDQWRKGWATEISAELTRQVFTKTKAYQVLAVTNDDNFASQGVLKKLGFEMIGTEQQVDRHGGNPVKLKKFRLQKP